MSVEVTTDADGRISLDLGEVHPGTQTKLTIGDDGIVRGVTAPIAPPETPAESGIPAQSPPEQINQYQVPSEDQ